MGNKKDRIGKGVKNVNKKRKTATDDEGKLRGGWCSRASSLQKI